MKFLIVSVITMLFGAVTVHSIQCYECGSVTSMEDCSSQETKSTCPGYLSKAVCAKVVLRTEINDVSASAFHKGCITEQQCKEIPGCNDGETTCNVECCADDLCNGGNGGEGEESAELAKDEGRSVDTFSCNECISSTSMDDCIKQQKIAICKAGWNRCGILEAHDQPTGRSMFRRGCVTEDYCRTYCTNLSNHGLATECEFSCCEVDKCN